MKKFIVICITGFISKDLVVCQLVKWSKRTLENAWNSILRQEYDSEELNNEDSKNLVNGDYELALSHIELKINLIQNFANLKEVK